MAKVKYRLGIALVDAEQALEALHQVGPAAANLSDEQWVTCLSGISEGRSKLFFALDTIKQAEAA